MKAPPPPPPPNNNKNKYIWTIPKCMIWTTVFELGLNVGAWIGIDLELGKGQKSEDDG
jgi:hypothetical protein